MIEVAERTGKEWTVLVIGLCEEMTDIMTASVKDFLDETIFLIDFCFELI